MGQFYEIMGLTWLARSPKQLDSILIANNVLQANSKITKLFKVNNIDSWCAAVADGENRIHDYANTSLDVLEIVNNQWKECREIGIDFNKIQQSLNQKNSESVRFIGSICSIALVTSTSRLGLLRIQHLGDSRVYGFSQSDHKWCCLTRDHTLIEELSHYIRPKENEIYPRVFSRLTLFFSAFLSSYTFNEDYGLAEYSQAKNHQLSAFDSILICTKGVHEVLRNSKFWMPFDKDVTHLEWLTAMKQKLIEYGAYDNASMVLIRLNVE